MFPYEGRVEIPVPPTLTARVEDETSEVPLKKTGAPVVNEVAFVPPFAIERVPVVSESAMPRDEVANAVTFPGAPVRFPRMVFAAIVAIFVRATPFVVSEREPLVPPMNEPRVPEYESSDARVGVEVALVASVPAFP